MPPAAAPRHSRVIVLGSGPAGYTAAIYAARAMLEPVLIAGFDQGGQLMITTDVENYPGFAEPIQGPWLMDQMRAQAEHVGAKLVSDHIVEARLGRRPFELLGDSGALHLRRAHYRDRRQGQMAGHSERGEIQGLWRLRLRHLRRLLLSRQEGYRRRRRQYGGRGGALSLQHRRPCDAGASARHTPLPSGCCRSGLRQRPNVEILFDHAIDEIFGDDRSARRHACARKKHAHRRDAACSSRRRLRRHRPSARPPNCSRASSTLKPSGYIAVEPGTTRTNIPGVFAAGDVADEIYRQAVTAAGLGCMAALDVERYLLDAAAPAA